MASGNVKFYRRLRWARIGVALVMLTLVTLSFMYFSSELNRAFEVLHLQFVPSLLAASGVALASLVFTLLLTWCFGRVYCSWLCPMGIWQDVVSRISLYLRGDRKGVPVKKRPGYTYHRPQTLLRWSVAAFVAAFMVAGIMYPLMLLDPYSNWGQMVRLIFSPLIQLFSNLLSLITPDVAYRQLAPMAADMFILVLALFILITVMSAMRGRLWCNTVCPVGSILGAISQRSLFRPVIAKDMCVRCGSCASKCKSECIDLEAKEIDNSRCVHCYDCMTSCGRGGVTIEFRYGKNGSGKSGECGDACASCGGGTDTSDTNRERTVKPAPESNGRREAVLALGTIVALAAVGNLKEKRRLAGDAEDAASSESVESGGVLPPGAVSLENLKSNCIACHACLSACPSKIISYSKGEYGLDGLFLPVLKYDHGFCNYECHKCSDVCPAEALTRLTVEKKKRTQIGRVKFIAKNCIVFRDQTDCGACDEHCPTKAITMKEWKNREDGLRFPTVNPDICIGCGACEYICPARPDKAMKVMPLAVHGESLPPKVEEQVKVEVDDFGF